MVYVRSDKIEVKKVLDIISNSKYKVNSSISNCYHKGMVTDILDQIVHDIQANIGWDEIPSTASQEREL